MSIIEYCKILLDEIDVTDSVLTVQKFFEIEKPQELSVKDKLSSVVFSAESCDMILDVMRSQRDIALDSTLANKEFNIEAAKTFLKFVSDSAKVLTPVGTKNINKGTQISVNGTAVLEALRSA